MSFFEHQQWLVSTLAPVHLGTGQDYESTSYVIADGVMYAFSDSALFKALKPNHFKQISDAADRGDRGLVAIQKLLREQKDELKQHSEQLIAIGAGVEQFYDKRMNEDGKNFNQMLLPKTAAEMYSGRPFIPGSAIKGAIRTALMNKKVRENPRLKPDSREKTLDILQKVHEFKKVNDDPFKTIKVADATGATQTLHKKIVLVNSQHWDDAKKSKSARPALLESIAAGQINAFLTDLRLWSAEHGKRVVQSCVDLVKQVNDYYLKQLKDELTRNSDAGYYGSSYNRALQDLLQDQQFANAISTGQAMLLRLGKFSGAVSKTLDDVRSIKILGQKGSPAKYKSLPNEQRLVASTENGSSNCEPLGWVVLTQKDIELKALSAFAKAVYDQDEQLQKLASVAEELEQKRHALQQKAAAKAQAEAAEAAAEAEKAQQLAAMSAAELSIHQLLERKSRGEGKGAGAGHLLWTDLKKAVADSSNWQDAEKQTLLVAAKDIAAHLGIDWKKNDKAKAVIKSIGVSD